MNKIAQGLALVALFNLSACHLLFGYQSTGGTGDGSPHDGGQLDSSRRDGPPADGAGSDAFDGAISDLQFADSAACPTTVTFAIARSTNAGTARGTYVATGACPPQDPQVFGGGYTCRDTGSPPRPGLEAVRFNIRDAWDIACQGTSATAMPFCSDLPQSLIALQRGSSSVTATASSPPCPTGSLAAGGSCECDQTVDGLLIASYPAQFNGRWLWQCICSAGKNHRATVACLANCPALAGLNWSPPAGSTSQAIAVLAGDQALPMTASCSSGEQVIGGGCKISPSSVGAEPARLVESRASGTNGWFCQALFPPDNAGTLTAYALCRP
ncbi:MAG: hypothetical protein H6707_03635 [Deltaproteobacteria bacterium]|nr:hypothetical protein [Deltaproteobacteria bacterium]